MKKILFILSLLILISGCKSFKNDSKKPILISHRGACGYLPEHTIGSKIMAYTQGANYLEQDIALSKDNIPIVIHDSHLNSLTNVNEVFPEKKRKDGRHYVYDFTADELEKLDFHERGNLKENKAKYPERFPIDSKLKFKLHTLSDELELIQGLNKSTGKDVGIYCELKDPWEYKDGGKKLADIVIKTINEYGYTTHDSNCYIQSFDPDILKYVRYNLNSELKIIQLINVKPPTPEPVYNHMLTKQGLTEIAEYADGIGLNMSKLFTNFNKSTDLQPNNIVKWAHECGLEVHAYTLRIDSLPNGMTHDDVCDALFKKAKVDGFFTDFPDKGVDYIEKNYK